MTQPGDARQPGDVAAEEAAAEAEEIQDVEPEDKDE